MCLQPRFANPGQSEKYLIIKSKYIRASILKIQVKIQKNIVLISSLPQIYS